MKNILKGFKYMLLVPAIVMVSSCSEDLVELNVDPNNPVTVPAVNLVTQAEYALNNLLWGRGLNMEWGMLMVQQIAQTEYAEESRYTVDANSFNGTWTTFYASILNELAVAKNMIVEDDKLVESRRANQLAIIDILTVHAYHNLTDLFGAAPFTQALNSLEFPLPSYDSQQAIYNGILGMLSSSLNAINVNEPSFDAGELIYGGDMAAWSKLGHSLMLRIAMRMSDVDQGGASTFINQAAGNLLTSNADNGMFVFSDEAVIANPLYVDNVVNNRDDFSVTDVLIDHLMSTGDPRLAAFAMPNNSGDFVGLPYGLTDGESFSLQTTTSRPSPSVRAAQAPAIIMDYAEVQFLLAEAYQRGILSGDAEAAYAEGVTASMNYWGIEDADGIAAYIAANPYDASDWKESIGTQKWLAFYMNGPQAWAEHRRLDAPSLAVPAAATNSSIPVRLPYPIDEEIRNGTNLSAVTSDPNDLNTKMWWDVN